MSNNLMRFDFQGAAVRLMVRDGEPWWMAGDACQVLGLANVGQALARLDEDDKDFITTNDGTPGSPTRAVINEAGLYSLIMTSRKPEAKEFRRWVTRTVLPSIRKTGGYAVKNSGLVDVTQLSQAVAMAVASQFQPHFESMGNRLDSLEETVLFSELTRAQQHQMQKSISKQAYEWAAVDGETPRQHYANMYGGLKEKFEVARYTDIPRCKFVEAMGLIGQYDGSGKYWWRDQRLHNKGA